MRRRQRSRVRDKDSNADLLRTAIFSAPLKTSLALTKGTGGPTWSRATTAWRFNDIGLLRQIPSGCAEFGGARLVTNLVAASEDVSTAAWTKSNCTAPTANSVVCGNSTSLQRFFSAAYSAVAGQVIFHRVRFSYVDIQFVQIRSSGSHSNGCANFDLVNGLSRTIGAASASGVIQVSPGVYDCWVKINIQTSASASLVLISFVSSLDSSFDATFVGDGIKSVGVTRLFSCDVTGRDASYVPEYVSVGSTVGKNFFLHTDDFSQSAWTKSNVTITQAAVENPVNGRVDAQKVEATSTGATTFYQGVSSTGSTSGNIMVVYAKQGSGATEANLFYMYNNTSATNLIGISFNYSTGGITYLVGSSGASAEALPNGWWKIQLVVSAGISDGDTIRGYIGFTGSSETAGEYLYSYRPYLGRGITAPEVIPVVGNAWDPHGSGADGVKYFSTDYTKNRALTSLNGLRKESSATNALLWSRDLSNAAWSTKTNITAAKTATGLDGIANSASTLTATSADAIILQPITLASAARCASTYVKRVTGTGTISFTQDGGSTWTDITSLINTSTYYRVQITATLANPSVGFKISTSGDAIEVDCVQNEAGSVATSPIVTTTATVTRNADSLTYQTSGNIDFTVGTCYSILKSSGALTSRFAVYLPGGSSFVNSSNENTSWSSYDGVNTVSKTGLDDMTAEAMVKRVVAWGGSTQKVTGNGATPASGVFDGSWGSGATISIGNTVQGYVGDVAIYNYKMTDAELQAVTK